jgi:hypothetical protein
MRSTLRRPTKSRLRVPSAPGSFGETIHSAPCQSSAFNNAVSKCAGSAQPDALPDSSVTCTDQA